MKATAGFNPLAIIAFLVLALPSTANAQIGSNTEQIHESAFSMAGPRLELRDDGLVYKTGSKKPYSGTISKNKSGEMRYVDGLLEMLTLQRNNSQPREKRILIDGYRIYRKIEYGDDNLKISDQIFIDDERFIYQILRKNNDPSSVEMPDIATLRIEKSGVVSTYWHSNGNMATSLRYVKGRCCLATGWHENGQKRFEQKYVDGIGSGALGIWDADGNDLSLVSDPVVDADLIKVRENLVYLGYSTEPFTGKVVGPANAQAKRGRTEYLYVDGKNHGIGTEWYSNDQRKSEEWWIKGEKASKTLWFETGELKSEYFYPQHPEFADKLQATDAGTPMVPGEFLHLTVKGYNYQVIHWYENGQKRSESTNLRLWNNRIGTNYSDIKHGRVTIFSKDGRKTSEAVYEYGLVKSKTMWRADGQEKCEVFRESVDQPLHYREWDKTGEEGLAMSFADASRESLSKAGYNYACSVHKRHLGYNVRILQ